MLYEILSALLRTMADSVFTAEDLGYLQGHPGQL
jgi:hypothetical protein